MLPCGQLKNASVKDMLFSLEKDVWLAMLKVFGWGAEALMLAVPPPA